MTLTAAHKHHVRKTTEAMKAEISAPKEPAFPTHAGIALYNAKHSIEHAEKRIDPFYQRVDVVIAIACINKARRMLDEAEAAILGRVDE